MVEAAAVVAASYLGIAFQWKPEAADKDMRGCFVDQRALSLDLRLDLIYHTVVSCTKNTLRPKYMH